MTAKIIYIVFWNLQEVFSVNAYFIKLDSLDLVTKTVLAVDKIKVEMNKKSD